MKEYTIELYTTIKVKAESEDEAIDKAFEIVSTRDLAYEVSGEDDCD